MDNSAFFNALPVHNLPRAPRPGSGTGDHRNRGNNRRKSNGAEAAAQQQQQTPMSNDLMICPMCFIDSHLQVVVVRVGRAPEGGT